MSDLTDVINILTLGSGGREAQFAWHASQSRLCGNNYIAPGNGGSHEYAEAVNIPLNFPIGSELVAFLHEKNIGLVLTGSENPLCDGVADIVRGAGVPCVGVSQAASIFEGDKSWAADFRNKYKIPQPEVEIFNNESNEKNIQAAIEYGRAKFDQGVKGLVPKFAGLAGGKGAIICNSLEEYELAIRSIGDMMKPDSGLASDRNIVVEEFLEGPEVSVTVLVGSNSYHVLSYSQDNKAIGPNPFGIDPLLNTGGMGACTIDLPRKLEQEIEDMIIKRTINGAKSEGRDLTGGILYVGLMITEDGPKVLEYNARMGDPETQVVLPRVNGDVLQLLYHHATDTLHKQDVGNKAEHFATRVMAAGGYPKSYKENEGKLIEGINLANCVPGVRVNIAGTRFEGGQYFVKGSRNLNVTASGDTPEAAYDLAMNGVYRINSDGLFVSKNVGENLPGIAALHKMVKYKN